MWKSISHSEKNPAGGSASCFRENQATPSSAGMINCFGFMHFHLLTEKKHAGLTRRPNPLPDCPANSRCRILPPPVVFLVSCSRYWTRVWKMQHSGSFHLGCLEVGWWLANTETEMRADQTELKLRDGGGALTGGGRVQHNMSAMRYRLRYHEIFMVEAVQREIPSGAERKH